MRRADAILEDAVPPTDQELGAVLLTLADVLRLQKKPDASAEMYKRDLAVATSAWGRTILVWLQWLDGYVSVLRDQKEFAEAARLELQATGHAPAWP